MPHRHAHAYTDSSRFFRCFQLEAWSRKCVFNVFLKISCQVSGVRCAFPECNGLMPTYPMYSVLVMEKGNTMHSCICREGVEWCIFMHDTQVDYLEENCTRLEANIVEKRKNLEAVTNVMQIKIMHQQQAAASKAWLPFISWCVRCINPRIDIHTHRDLQCTLKITPHKMCSNFTSQNILLSIDKLKFSIQSHANALECIGVLFAGACYRRERHFAGATCAIKYVNLALSRYIKKLAWLCPRTWHKSATPTKHRFSAVAGVGRRGVRSVSYSADEGCTAEPESSGKCSQTMSLFSHPDSHGQNHNHEIFILTTIGLLLQISYIPASDIYMAENWFPRVTTPGPGPGYKFSISQNLINGYVCITWHTYMHNFSRVLPAYYSAHAYKNWHMYVPCGVKASLASDPEWWHSTLAHMGPCWITPT